MKKTLLASLAVASALSASAYAANGLSSYYSSQHPAPKASLSTMMHPPTDITVINASTNSIYAIIPGSPVNDLLYSGQNDHIYGYDPNIYYTHLVLQDPYHSTFFSTPVCRLAIVTVYGSPGNYRIVTDSDLCN